MYKTKPFAIVREWESLRVHFAEVAEKHSDLLTFHDSDDFQIIFNEKDTDSIFFYRISNPSLDSKGDITFLLEYAPQHNKKVAAYKASTYSKNVSDNFNLWVQNIIEYNNHEKRRQNRAFEKAYAEERLASIPDREGDDIRPFTDEEQKLLYTTLLIIEEYVQPNIQTDIYSEKIYRKPNY